MPNSMAHWHLKDVTITKRDGCAPYRVMHIYLHTPIILHRASSTSLQKAMYLVYQCISLTIWKTWQERKQGSTEISILSLADESLRIANTLIEILKIKFPSHNSNASCYGQTFCNNLFAGHGHVVTPCVQETSIVTTVTADLVKAGALLMSNQQHITHTLLH